MIFLIIFNKTNADLQLLLKKVNFAIDIFFQLNTQTMKKHLLLITLFIIGISSAAIAQGGGSAYNNGDNLLNIGIGIGSPFFGSGYSSSLPVNPSLSYEKGVTDAISVGGQLSYASSKFDDYPYSNYRFKESAFYIGARGSYHFNQDLNLDSRFDIYGGASLGYVIVNVSDNTGYSGSAASDVGFGLFAGGKYYFQENTAVYAELGYQSLAFLNIGVAFKL